MFIFVHIFLMLCLSAQKTGDDVCCHAKQEERRNGLQLLVNIVTSVSSYFHHSCISLTLCALSVVFATAEANWNSCGEA